MTLEEQILLAFARDSSEPETGATASYTVQNSLGFARKTIKSFDEFVRGKKVLDYGCGPGWQAVAMVTQCAAASVFGLDVIEHWIDHASKLAAQHGCAELVTFGRRVPPEMQGRFDVVVSLSAFEHYADPAGELQKMRAQLELGGVILLSFAEPWWSHSGSHIGNYTRIPFTNWPLPWINLFFSERALLGLRSRFRSDHPEQLDNISGGLNRMTIGKFERIISESGMEVDSLRLFATKSLPFVTKIPLIRELLTSAASCILREDHPATG